MSPGPSFVAVSHKAVTATRLEALMLVAGIVLVNTLWASAALFGIRMVFTLFPWLFWAVKIMGAAYLMWFGFRLVKHAGKPLPEKSSIVTRAGLAHAWKAGVLTNLSNPKSMAFYASIFSTSIPAHTDVNTLLLLVAVVMCVSSLWYGFVAMVLSMAYFSTFYRRIKSGIERTCGMFLIVFGVRQAI